MRLGLIHRTHYYIRIEFTLEVGGEVIQDLLAPSVEVIVDAPVGDAFQVDEGEHAALVKVHLLALHEELQVVAHAKESRATIGTTRIGHANSTTVPLCRDGATIK